MFRIKIFFEKLFSFFKRNQVAIVYSGNKFHLNTHFTLSHPQMISLAEDFLSQKHEIFPKLISEIKKRKILGIEDLGNEENVLIKCYVYKDLPRKLEQIFFFSDAQRNYFTMCFLQSKGVSVPPPLTLLNTTKTVFNSTTFLFLRFLENAQDYKQFLNWLDTQDQNTRNLFFETLGRELGKLHKYDVYTRDTDKNTMVEVKDGSFLIYFLDFDSSYPWQIANLRHTYRTLGHFLIPGHKYTLNELSIFTKYYLKERNKVHWFNKIMIFFSYELVKFSARFLH